MLLRLHLRFTSFVTSSILLLCAAVLSFGCASSASTGQVHGHMYGQAGQGQPNKASAQNPAPSQKSRKQGQSVKPGQKRPPLHKGSQPAQHPTSAQSAFTQSGKASYYADKYQNRKTASGELFNQNAMTAAHRKLPFGTRVKVTNTRNGKSVIVRINDRGPYAKGHIIDLSRSAFSVIGNTRAGILNVTIEVVK